MPGIEATGTVVRGGNRTVSVRVPLVARHPDGQVAFEVVAAAVLVLPAGVVHPTFELDSREAISTEEVPA